MSIKIADTPVFVGNRRLELPRSVEKSLLRAA